jgi:hypothetical protein
MCPFCGKEPKRGHVHFSFSERGGKCFCCGQSASLLRLAELWGHGTPQPALAPAPALKSRPAQRAVRNWDALVAQYAANPRRLEAWASYKPLPEGVIRARRLGLGAFPRHLSKCQHERLMVPLYEDGRCVGIRGRSLGCSCGKWLSPLGSRCVLYNAERLGQARGKVVFVVENPIDALMLELLHSGVVAVATLGVSMWQDAWTDLLRRCGARRVVVAFDNDVPGNGGNDAARASWLARHGSLPVRGGIRLVNRLLEAGIPARLYDWGDAPVGADIGSVLLQKRA